MPEPAHFTTEVAVPLEGDVDLGSVLSEIPTEYALKGMFFTRYVQALGDGWASAQTDLDTPPSRARYRAFEFYPLADYLRLFDRVARARFPGSTREAYRLLARGEVDVFAESTLGKVTLALLHTPAEALLRYPESFGILARGPSAHATRLGPTQVRVTYPQYRGSVEYAVGVLEGIVLAFESRPTLTVTIDSAVVVDITW